MILYITSVLYTTFFQCHGSQLHVAFICTFAIGKYGKTYVKRPLSKRLQIGFQDQFALNAGQKYYRMLQGERILQYFRPSLSYHLSLRSFCLFLSGRLRQVLLYHAYLTLFIQIVKLLCYNCLIPQLKRMLGCLKNRLIEAVLLSTHRYV